MNTSLAGLLAAALLAGSCAAGTTEPSVSFDSESCSSSNPADWPAGPHDILVVNDSTTRGAVIMGTYNNGYSRDDLVDYGSDVSTRPPFIDALEIFEAAPESTTTVLFDHEPGTYFFVCMPTTDTMVVLDDFTITD
ncbi:MAG: hypothetical protein ACR2NG_08340 [Acidimicrobiia bacterium]